MKTTYLVAMIPAILSMLACQKSLTVNTPSHSSYDSSVLIDTGAKSPAVDTAVRPPFPQTAPSAVNACPALPIYGDSLVYMQPAAGQDAILTPLNNPGTGKYYAWPTGMAIDNTTGVIDLSKSQTGMKYVIGFVPAGTTDTCLSTLIVGGASYYDSVYVASSGGVKAVPYFNANPAGGSNCDGQGNGSGCSFDVTGSAEAASVFVNNSSGEIDLQKTLDGQSNQAGVFGANPVDGQTVTATIYYQIKQGSNNAMEHIDVQFMYYSSASSIPASLMNSLNTKLNNALSGTLISTSANPRPPLVIITRRM
jgi:hypothetical protein